MLHTKNPKNAMARDNKTGLIKLTRILIESLDF